MTLAITDAAAMAARRAVPADDRALLEARRRDREAVRQAQAAGDGDAPQAVAQRREVGACRPRESMPRTQRDVTDTRVAMRMTRG